MRKWISRFYSESIMQLQWQCEAALARYVVCCSIVVGKDTTIAIASSFTTWYSKGWLRGEVG